MKLLYKILGINIPTIEEIKEQTEEAEIKEINEQFLAYITFALSKDGSVHVKTEWINESMQLASVYAQLLYQISVGAMEDGIIDVLLKHGKDHVQSQEFIGKIIDQFHDLKQKYKNMPLISPSQALAVTTQGK